MFTCQLLGGVTKWGVICIKAHEIQGVLALENSFNRVGLDHVVRVKVASTAVVSGLLGLSHEEIINTLSLAWVDGQPLRTYRHAPNTGSRKSWAAGDAANRPRLAGSPAPSRSHEHAALRFSGGLRVI